MNRVLLFLVIGLVNLVFSGYVLSMYWSWFLAPLFSLGAISIPQAMGVHLFARHLIMGPIKVDNTEGESPDDKKARERRELVTMLLSLILKPPILLIIGYGVSVFI